jgi:integrase
MPTRSLVKQVSDAFDSIFKPGTSRHEAKLQGTAGQVIFSYQTLKTYKARAIAAVRWIRDNRYAGQLRELRVITHDDWIAYIRDGENRKLAGGSLRATIAGLHKLEAGMRQRGWWRNEAAFVPQIGTSVPRSQPRLGFSQAHAAAIVANLTGEVELAAQLALSSGLRINELARLRVEDIDFENKTIKIVGSNAKGGRQRIVTRLLDPTVLASIPRDRNYVFTNPGNFARVAQRQVAAARDAAGISAGTGLGMHAFRATYAEQFLRRAITTDGLSEAAARRALTLQLGHSRVEVTYRYCPKIT